MAYKLKEIEARGLSVATTLTYGFKFGYFEEAVNTTFIAVKTTNILMLPPLSNVENRNSVNVWEFKIVCFVEKLSTETKGFGEQFDQVKDRLKLFISTLCNNTNISRMTPELTFTEFSEHKDLNEHLACSCTVKLQVTDC